MYCYNTFAVSKFMSKYEHFLFLSFSKLCICTCASTCSCVYTCGDERSISWYFSSLYTLIFETGSILGWLDTQELSTLTGQQTLQILFFSPPNTGITNTCHPALLFTWVWGILTRVLLLVKQTFCPLSCPPSILRGSCDWHLEVTKKCECYLEKPNRIFFSSSVLLSL